MNKNANQSRFCSKEGFRKGVILSLTQDLRRLSLQLQLCNNVRGRRQIKSAMTPLCNNGGFTLIELLVVVLIIGILAAVAMPQYRVAVEKSRAVEALTTVDALKKAMDVYVLEHGIENVYFVGAANQVDLDIDVVSHLDCSDTSRGRCYSKYFGYIASCSLSTWVGGSDSCGITVERTVGEDDYYGLILRWNSNEILQKTCSYEGEVAEKICNSLSSLGWEPEEN